jgi:hypothetical protein
MKKIWLLACLMFVCYTVSSAQSVKIDIDCAHPGLKIPDEFSGLSFETRALVKDETISPDNTALLNMMKLLGPGILRIGGNSVENSVFSPGKRSKKTGQDTITTDDIDRAFAFAHKLGWRVIFGVNLGKYDPVLSAKEVQYTWKYKSQIHSFEIGNEPNHFTSHQTRDSSWGYSNFVTEFEAYTKAIRELVPEAPVSGPVTASKYEPWLVDFAKDEGKNICMLSHHHYPMGPDNATVDKMLSKKLMGTITTLFKNMVAVGKAHDLPFRLAECNSVYRGGKEGVSNTFASALWGADFMFSLAQSGAVGLNVHTGATNPYTPISFGKGVFTAKPLFYGMMLFRFGSSGSFLPVTLSDEKANVSCYAVKGPAGDVTCTFINKDTANNYSCVVSFKGTMKSKRAEVMRLKAPSVYSVSDVTLAGESVNSAGSWTPKTIEKISADESGDFNITIDAGSAASIHFIAGNKK